MSENQLTGVILSAGKGSRIDPFNTHYPKPLLPIANRPIMGHHIEIFRTLGISEVKIVVGHLMDRIINHFGRGGDQGVNIEYVEQRSTLGIAHAVGQLADRVEGDLLLVLGDIFYVPRDLPSMVDRFRAQGGGACLAVMREPDREALKKNFSVELSSDGLVRKVIEKPRNPPNDLKGCGIYLFGPEIFDAVRKTPRTALRDEYEITTSLQILIDDGFPVSVAEVVEWDYNITFAKDLLNGNLKYLKAMGLESVISDSAQVHEDAVLEHCVVGDDVRITAPVVISDSVILPGSVIDSPREISRCIISPESWHQC